MSITLQAINKERSNTIISLQSWQNIFSFWNEKTSEQLDVDKHIAIIDAYTIPIESGQQSKHPYTDQEWDLFSHVVLTVDGYWNPAVLDHDHDDEN